MFNKFFACFGKSYPVILPLFLLLISAGGLCAQDELRARKFSQLLKSGTQESWQKFLNEWTLESRNTPALMYGWAQYYYRQKNYRLALLFIGQTIEKAEKPEFGHWFLQGEIQQKSNMFSEAIISFEKALSLNNRSRETELRLRQCRFGEKLKATSMEVRISNAGKTVNGAGDEIRPFVSPDFLRIVFSRETSADFRIMEADGSRGSWENVRDAQLTSNQPGSYRFSGVSRDGNLTILESDRGKGDLYFMENQNGKWSDPKAFAWNSPSFREYSASVSADGNVLFFVSDRSGNPDIWFCRKNNSGWSKPVKADPAINSSSEEDSPWLDADGQYLYFSSKGHDGLGGFDVFRVPFLRKGAPAENIGYPVNSASDERDFSMMPDEKTAFYSSNREDGYGGFDLYSVRIGMGPSSRLILFKGSVSDAYGTPVDAQVVITETGQSKPAASIKANKETGTFVTLLPSGKSYSVLTEKEGYLFHSDFLNFQPGAAEGDAERRIRLQKILPGTSLVLNNIFFDAGKSSLRRESSPELQKLLLILRQNPGIRAEISGHMEPGGPEDVLQKLSENRAQAVVDYLVATGIKSTRLLAKGYGSTKPPAGEKAERQGSGTRTEFRVLSIQ